MNVLAEWSAECERSARKRASERDVLLPEKIEYFGNSSGSSSKGKPKFLPIAERQIKFQRGSAADSLYRYLVWRGEDDFTTGYTLGLWPEGLPLTDARSALELFATEILPWLQALGSPIEARTS